LPELDDLELNLGEKAKKILKKIIDSIIEDGEVRIITKEGINSIILDITTSNPGMIIGRHGHILDALQYIVNIIVNNGIKEFERSEIIIDIEGYRERRKDIVSKYAREKAEIVKISSKKVALCFMNTVERKIVHLVLQEDPLITTYSEGVEPYRRVIIAPREIENNKNNKISNNKEKLSLL
jgi:spoIIIJ-associated protein